MPQVRVDAPAPQQGPEREDEDTSPHDRSGREAQRPDAFKQAAGMKQQQRSKRGSGAKDDGEQSVEWKVADELRRPPGQFREDPLADRLGNQRRRAIALPALKRGEARLQVPPIPRTHRTRRDVSRERGSRRVAQLVHHLLPCFFARHGCISARSEEHTSELQSQSNLVCRLLLEKKKTIQPSKQTLLMKQA